MSRLTPAQLTWQDQQPRSVEFDDIYFNFNQGEAESEHVFIQGNHLRERFAHLAPTQEFVIAETGFGTGLNFFVARKAWHEIAPVEARLHFISFEKHPLSLEDMRRALSQVASATDILEDFLAQYPPLQEGYHRLFLDQGRVLITLILGDLVDTLPELEGGVDAWFLDGFAPAKNPQMWQASVFQHLARLSRPNCTLATFTVAKPIRQHLTEAGFVVEKRKGFGRKREMLCAYWPETHSSAVATPPREVVIVGAGLAGATLARLLAERGIEVHLLEAAAQIAKGASGNRQGALFVKPPLRPTPASQIQMTGLGWMRHYLRALGPEAQAFSHLSGLLQLANSAQEVERQTQLTPVYDPRLVHFLSAEQIQTLTGRNILSPGLFFPEAGWVSPPAFCHFLLQHPRIHLHLNSPVTDVNWLASEQVWQLHTPEHRWSTTHLVLCNATEAKHFSVLAHLPLKAIRGQTSEVAAQGLPELNQVICGEGYISPAWQGHYCFGASFDLHQAEPNLRDADHLSNLQQLTQVLPEFAGLDPKTFSGRVSFRSSTPDYLPLVGQVGDYSAYLTQYARLRTDANWPISGPAPLLPGLYVSLGHGSKGLATCLLSAELLAAQMLDLAWPLPRHLAQRLDPNRFILRDLIRRRI
ncbi:bifunctional tRNA (5-methylaminomethyl-2-thiouridine)(34)-methyltransferase MnmD/FAD-dependent 5-carboxymethylaminomethyl-2-thiouridine(34) oxidoreductase MnmC [Nitrincola tapanii]|uniref:tRNA 5-methylaminomethyl-2-thiouridine biosynthesis bifunctional protein MnmC n=1 Tax=Nitrincola tapanii TaxID=1708751 RepID=A0A5A9W2P3_9GAMM|nr:bifunctional tRNA (5-methylaminomethyl-2-thiouridine)(34)-methyltransferase MnmD/FAD-dependent 5-carboxymethylaminomethyl-2-thiouridine(34) oxidoreductase MnmC [Nitrincola tapanii]KAA0874774.1 bifunctional tRNA (5-methylaminomethyl-2-thiouridine)(34)-methyltransferase MnmD/FAD-dependent 5-carboxymethylaminomethyl-2-thiouridine(34) oxidoreductase MnmC [Nitrincola tapanii]